MSSLVRRGAFTAFVSMMVIGLATVAWWIGQTYFHSPEARQYIAENYDYYIRYTVSFVVFFGASALFGGALLGIGFYFGTHWLSSRRN